VVTNRTPMSDRADADDQRTDPRITATHRVHLVVSLHGFDHDDERYEATGITVNISRRGALVRVGQPVATGTRCLVHLPDGDRRLGKTLIYGTVVRTREIEDTFEVAVEFDTRLRRVSIEDSLDGI
jgi:hypothetical protein